VRRFPSYKGQRNYPDLFWVRDDPVADRLGEPARAGPAVAADFDPQVSWISSQPFWVSGRDRSALRHHVPDFMLASTDGT